MRIFSRLLGKLKRTIPPAWLPGALITALGGGKSHSGATVNETTALTYTAFYAAVDLIGRSVGQLPGIVYKRGENMRERALKHPAYRVLHDRPNPEQTPFVFYQTMQGWILTWGNAYAEIERNKRGAVVALHPIPPNRISLKRDDAKELVYVQKNDAGEVVAELSASDVIHVHGLGDGLMGWSPVRQFREAIGLGLAAEKYGATFFGNDARPGGVLEHPNSLQPGSADRFAAHWEKAHSGDNAHKVAILEEGMTWKQIGIPNNEAQFLESRTFSIDEIARIFHIPPHMLGDLSHATFTNIEHQAIEFVQHAITPWLKCWEQELNYKLFSVAEREAYYCEFLVDSLLRADTATRYAAYGAGIKDGWLRRNEARVKENLDPFKGGDELLVPLNMGPASQLGEEREAPDAEEDQRAALEDVKAVRAEAKKELEGAADDAKRHREDEAEKAEAHRRRMDEGRRQQEVKQVESFRRMDEGRATQAKKREADDKAEEERRKQQAAQREADAEAAEEHSQRVQRVREDAGSAIETVERLVDTIPKGREQRALLLTVCEKIVRKEVNAMSRKVKRAEADEFYEAHKSHIRETLAPAVRACQAALGLPIRDILPAFAAQHCARNVLDVDNRGAWADSQPAAMVDEIMQLCRGQ